VFFAAFVVIFPLSFLVAALPRWVYAMPVILIPGSFAPQAKFRRAA
jgi:hypothetical protein